MFAATMLIVTIVNKTTTTKQNKTKNPEAVKQVKSLFGILKNSNLRDKTQIQATIQTVLLSENKGIS